ncbi:uncharacterized transposon-derived protein F54H12.3 [Trichonephila clavipes]|nr:uncharacterized transposon-derived protein F54H12.3 [Trichonephila clavipes]
MIKKYGAIENAAIDNMFQCMDFLTAYKTFCEGPIENTLPSSLDVSLVKKKDVKHWLSQKDAYTLHKPVRHKFQRNRVFVSDIDRQFQADLVDMQSLAEFNKGYKYLLTCIDLFSKFAWAVPLKDKFGKSVKSGLEIIFKERKPKVLQTDADATSKPYGYLLIDLKPETDESLRVRTASLKFSPDNTSEATRLPVINTSFPIVLPPFTKKVKLFVQTIDEIFLRFHNPFEN